jgi:hypothetical protein
MPVKERRHVLSFWLGEGEVADQRSLSVNPRQPDDPLFGVKNGSGPAKQFQDMVIVAKLQFCNQALFSTLQSRNVNDYTFGTGWIRERF